MAKLKVVHKWFGLSRVHSFMFYSGSGKVYVTALVGRVGSRKSDPRPTLTHPVFGLYSSQHRPVVFRYLGDGETDRREILRNGRALSRMWFHPFWFLYL